LFLQRRPSSVLRYSFNLNRNNAQRKFFDQSDMAWCRRFSNSTNCHYLTIWLSCCEFVFKSYSKRLPYSCPAHYASV